MAKKGKLIIPEKFRDLVGTQSPDRIEITEENLRTALNKLVSCRRRPMGKNATLESIYETIEPEHIFKNIKSAGNLKSGVVENITKPEKKTEELRDLPIDDELAGYTESERKFIQRRLSEYESFYSLDGPNDKFGILDVVDIELRIQTLRSDIRANISKKKDTSDDDKTLADLRKQWSALLKDLNLTKLQRDNPRNKKDEANTDIKSILDEADRSDEEFAAEVQHELDEEERMLAEKHKRS